MIARIRDYFYRLWRTRGDLACPPEYGWARSLAGRLRQAARRARRDGVCPDARVCCPTAEHTAAIARAVLDATQPIVEIRAAITDPDQFRTLVDLARAGDEGQFVELARCLGVPADRVETLWEGTVRRLPDPPEREERGRCCEGQWAGERVEADRAGDPKARASSGSR